MSTAALLFESRLNEAVNPQFAIRNRECPDASASGSVLFADCRDAAAAI